MSAFGKVKKVKRVTKLQRDGSSNVTIQRFNHVTSAAKPSPTYLFERLLQTLRAARNTTPALLILTNALQEMLEEESKK